MKFDISRLVFCIGDKKEGRYTLVCINKIIRISCVYRHLEVNDRSTVALRIYKYFDTQPSKYLPDSFINKVSNITQ